MDMGIELSPEIEAKIPKVIQLIEEEVATSLRQFPERQSVEAALEQAQANQQKPA